MEIIKNHSCFIAYMFLIRFKEALDDIGDYRTEVVKSGFYRIKKALKLNERITVTSDDWIAHIGDGANRATICETTKLTDTQFKYLAHLLAKGFLRNNEYYPRDLVSIANKCLKKELIKWD
jgi:hypothetical protein